MTDHWKDVERVNCDCCTVDGVYCERWVMPVSQVDAARAKDAEEIADLTRKLRVFLSFPCHWTRGEIEYTTDCGQVAFPVTSVPDGQCHGCGRPIVVS